jgi:Hypothetical protein (DUF2513)
MKRDWDVVRKILLALETSTAARFEELHSIEEVSNEVMCYHTELLVEGNFALGGVQYFDGHPEPVPTPIPTLFRLTWSGHELLEKIRHDSTWEKIKHKAEEKGVSLSFEVVTYLAKGYAKQRLGVGFD